MKWKQSQLQYKQQPQGITKLDFILKSFAFTIVRLLGITIYAPNSSDLALSNYHLSQSLSNSLNDKTFNSHEDVKMLKFTSIGFFPPRTSNYLNKKYWI